MGTEGFAAPELTTAAHTAGPPSDFYSVGQLVGWLVTQQWPHKNIPLRPSSGPWRRFVDVLTKEGPLDRPQSVRDVRRGLLVVSNEFTDQTITLSDADLLSAVQSGSLEHLKIIIERAISEPDSHNYFFDILPSLTRDNIRHVAQTIPQQLQEATRQLEHHRNSPWGRRGFDSLNEPILFALRVAQVGGELGNGDLFEVGTTCALRWEANYNRFKAHREIVHWFATLSPEQASFVAMVIAVNPDIQERFSDIATDLAISRIIRDVFQGRPG
jgi:hypothetical protein